MENATRPMFRGIFALEDETCPEWKSYVMENGLPNFKTKEECEAFVRSQCSRGSNPDHPNLHHIFTMLVSEKQIRNVLIPKIQEYESKYPFKATTFSEFNPKNRFACNSPGHAVYENVNFRLQLPFHVKVNRESTMNTLWYLFHHMRCGIFVMIRAKKVVLFVPFVNNVQGT